LVIGIYRYLQWYYNGLTAPGNEDNKLCSSPEIRVAIRNMQNVYTDRMHYTPSDVGTEYYYYEELVLVGKLRIWENPRPTWYFSDQLRPWRLRETAVYGSGVVLHYTRYRGYCIKYLTIATALLRDWYTLVRERQY